jgi:hypothetical protein
MNYLSKDSFPLKQTCKENKEASVIILRAVDKLGQFVFLRPGVQN